MDDSSVVELYSAADVYEAHSLRDHLELAGIRSRLVGDTLQGAAGGLPLGEVIAPRIWVARADQSRARRVLRKWLAEREGGLSDAPAATWHCPGCGEEVAQGFRACWNCGTSADGRPDPDFRPDEDVEDALATEPRKADTPSRWRVLLVAAVLAAVLVAAIWASLYRYDPVTHYNRGIAALDRGEFDEAIASFNEAIRLDRTDVWAYHARGTAWYAKAEYRKAIADLSEAIRLDPACARTYYDRGNAWYAVGEYKNAVADYDEAIRLDPDQAMTYYARGLALELDGEHRKAIPDYDMAIRLDPQYALAYLDRGVAWKKLGDFQKALADYEEAARLDPEDPRIASVRAWLLATCPDEEFRDAKKAVQLARRACQFDGWEYWWYVDTLAAAYAEAGDFEEAVTWQTKAIELGDGSEAFVGQSGETERAKAWSRLESYRDKKPYRDLNQ
jgi:tetratricopeptide (TPR) repeat protein